MNPKAILCPLPDRDFDVTEVAVPWKLLTEAGNRVVFATEQGAEPRCDPLLIDGVVFGKLGAAEEPIRFYRELETSSAFKRPGRWNELALDGIDALLLPGGHAQGMRQYLDSEPLARQIAALWKRQVPVAAICHGVLAVARAKDPESGLSVLNKSRTTCLPAYMEGLAYGLTFWKRGRYYRTYPEYVEAEVRAALADPRRQFERGPLTFVTRGTREDDTGAFVVQDGHYVSARWPGDAYAFARALIARL